MDKKFDELKIRRQHNWVEINKPQEMKKAVKKIVKKVKTTTKASSSIRQHMLGKLNC